VPLVVHRHGGVAADGPCAGRRRLEDLAVAHQHGGKRGQAVVRPDGLQHRAKRAVAGGAGILWIGGGRAAAGEEQGRNEKQVARGTHGWRSHGASEGRICGPKPNLPTPDLRTSARGVRTDAMRNERGRTEARDEHVPQPA
jgi:hypothetical protein